MKIAVLTDIHYAPDGSPDDHSGELADIFFLRAIHRIERYIRPDVVVVAGDLCDNPHDLESLKTLNGYLKILTMPVIVIPGNHDAPPETFYTIIDNPGDHVDIKGYRFLIFHEGNEPENPAKQKALSDFPGRVISVRHIPPDNPWDSPCGEGNALDDIPGNCFLTISGHYHKSFQILRPGGHSCVSAPALCESPFRYQLIDINDATGWIEVTAEQLRLPPDLIDTHIHTRNAMCQENMDLDRTFQYAEAFGLAGFAFTEHSGQLYVNKEEGWGAYVELGRNGMNSRVLANRFPDYLSLLDESAGRFPFRRGLELDVGSHDILAKPEDLKTLSLLVGAVHWIDGSNMEEYKADFMRRVRELLRQDIQILAHPFRIFHWSKLPVPEDLFEPLSDLLKQAGVAAEINFHGNQPEPEFFAMCRKKGVKIALGSDSHNLYEIGEFYAHLKLLKAIGASRDDLFRFRD